MSKTFIKVKYLEERGVKLIDEVIIVTAGKLCSFWCGGKDEKQRKCGIYNKELKVSSETSNDANLPFRCTECVVEFVDND